jgi:hypothetical protein
MSILSVGFNLVKCFLAKPRKSLKFRERWQTNLGNGGIAGKKITTTNGSSTILNGANVEQMQRLLPRITTPSYSSPNFTELPMSSLSIASAVASSVRGSASSIPPRVRKRVGFASEPDFANDSCGNSSPFLGRRMSHATGNDDDDDDTFNDDAVTFGDDANDNDAVAFNNVANYSQDDLEEFFASFSPVGALEILEIMMPTDRARCRRGGLGAAAESSVESEETETITDKTVTCRRSLALFLTMWFGMNCFSLQSALTNF